MPFRTRQPLSSYSCGKIAYEQLEEDPQTHVSRIANVAQQMALPDCKNTDLELQLKAGVNLKKVNCMVIDGDAPAQAVAELSKTETKTEVKTETKEK